MSVILVRLFGVLVAGWAVRHVLAISEVPEFVRIPWAAGAMLWVGAAIYLIRGRYVRVVSLLVLVLLALEFWVLGVWNREGVSMLAWLAFIVAVTEGHPAERAFLIRTCATTVYGFGAISKLNPSWLAGEGIQSLPPLHPPLEWMSGPLSVPYVASAAAVSVILIELLIPAALWTRRFRVPAAVFGGAMHLTFVASLARTPFSFLHLLMLNGGLALCYLAFWPPIVTRDDSIEAVPGVAIPSEIMVRTRTRAKRHPAGHVPGKAVDVSLSGRD